MTYRPVTQEELALANEKFGVSLDLIEANVLHATTALAAPPTLTELAELTGYSRAEVASALRALERLGMWDRAGQ